MQDAECVLQQVFIIGRKQCKSPNFPARKEDVKSELGPGGGGSGGSSVLEESHVVGESRQLLLVWNQRDRRRICEERGRKRGGGLEG